MNTDEKPSLLWYLYGPPLIAIAAMLHFLVCLFLMLFVHEDRRKQIYEYYAPWGWGSDKS